MFLRQSSKQLEKQINPFFSDGHGTVFVKMTKSNFVSDYVDSKTGEVFKNSQITEPTLHYEDESFYFKTYEDGLVERNNLSPRGERTLRVIESRLLRMGMGEKFIDCIDLVWADNTFISDVHQDLLAAVGQRRNFQFGIAELKKKGWIKKAPGAHRYWINFNWFFRGKRVDFLKNQEMIERELKIKRQREAQLEKNRSQGDPDALPYSTEPHCEQPPSQN